MIKEEGIIVEIDPVLQTGEKRSIKEDHI